MYVVDQDSFLNAVCLLETNLGYLQLLDALKGIETDLGRQTTFKNGPRVIDLDILITPIAEQIGLQLYILIYIQLIQILFVLII